MMLKDELIIKDDSKTDSLLVLFELKSLYGEFCITRDNYKPIELSLYEAWKVQQFIYTKLKRLGFKGNK